MTRTKKTEEVATPTPAESEAPKSDLEPTEVETAEEPIETPTETETKKTEEVYWVEGYGNVNATSQATAEKKAKKILADRLK